LRTDHVKLESPSILTKKIFFARPLGGLGPPVYASGHVTAFRPISEAGDSWSYDKLFQCCQKRTRCGNMSRKFGKF